MSNIIIGIPRGLMYYKYKNLWINFFRELGIDVLISPPTTKKLFDYAVNDDSDLCIALKIYIEHIKYLNDKTDYILIPRIKDKELCTYYDSLYDIVSNTIDGNFLDYNIDEKNDEEIAFIKLGEKLGFGKNFSFDAYSSAKKQEYKKNKINYLLQQKKLKRSSKKILIISNDYIYFDYIINTKISQIIEQNNFDIIFSGFVNPDIQKDSLNDYFTYIKNLVNQVDKILLITTLPCEYNFRILYDILNQTDKKSLIINVENMFIDSEFESKLKNFIFDIKLVSDYE